MLQRLAQKVRTTGHATTGFIGNKYLLQALAKGNQTGLALELLLQTTLPSLGYQVESGATTLFENWSGGARRIPPAAARRTRLTRCRT